MRDLAAIDEDLRVLALVRAKIAAHAGFHPSPIPMDELLDERLQVAHRGGSVEFPAG